MRTANFAALLLATSIFPVALKAADLTLRVDARDVTRKHVHTQETLAVKGGPLTLAFPKWIPGEHMPSGPIDTMVGLVFKANGETLTWKRDPYNTFLITVNVPAGARTLEISLDTGLPTEGGSFSAGPTSSEQLAVISWNHFVLLPKGRDAATISTAAALLTPPGWHVVSALESHAGADGALQFESATLARLIDSPVQIGRYARQVDLAGAAPYPELKHSISIMADSEAALNVPKEFQADYTHLVAEAGALFGTRMYRHYTWLLTLSDHVAHFGLEHHESSDDRVDEDSVTEPAFKEGVAGLLAHEYVHSWNGKFRRPAGLLSPDYQTPMDDSLLWVYEGMTEFWGTVLPVRAGIQKPESYRDELAATVAYFEIESGDRWRPLADTAVEAQDLYEAPSASSSSRRGVDFYEASELLWLNVDSELRSRSGGRTSIDDFVKRFYAGAGGAPALKPYKEEDVYTTLAAVVPGDWRAIIRHHLDTLGPGAVMSGLESTGWKLTYSAEKNTWIEMGEKAGKTTQRGYSIGLTLDKDGGIIDASEDRAAARAGAGPGMKLVAVNGRKYTTEVLDAAIAAAKDSKKPIELMVDTGDYFRVISVPYFDGPRYPHLIRAEGRPDTLTEVLKHRT
jgi:predicted metalloprotease with PDZ domain